MISNPDSYADDHPRRSGRIAALIADEPDMVMVAEAANGREAVEEFGRHRPDTPPCWR
jgi:chemotaxis response regulator CheB